MDTVEMDDRIIATSGRSPCGVWSELASRLGGDSCSSSTRRVVALLAVVPEPITVVELSRVAHRRQVCTTVEAVNIKQVLERLVLEGCVELTGDYCEMREPWRGRLNASSVSQDQILVREGARAFAEAIACMWADAAPLAWAYAPRFFASAQLYEALQGFLECAEHFEEVCCATADTLAVLAWCQGVASLIENQPALRHRWGSLVQPVLPQVLLMLANENVPNGWFGPILRDLAVSARCVDDDAILELFAHAEYGGKEPEQCERRGIALVKLMLEGGETDRAVRLARMIDKRYWSFDTALILAVALYEKGCTRNDGAEELLEECIEVVETRSMEVMAVYSSIFKTRLGLLARANLALQRLKRLHSSCAREATNGYEALAQIESRNSESEALQESGYFAESHSQGEDSEASWLIAARAVERSIVSMEEGELVLKQSSTDPLQPRFVPYCRQQAIAWLLIHTPGAASADAKTDTVVRWALREHIWPLALEVDASRAEALAPGTGASCVNSMKGVERIRVGTTGGILEAEVERWDINPEYGPTSVVLRIPQFGVYARGRDINSAVSNLERVLDLLELERHNDYLRPFPFAALLDRWKFAHTLQVRGEPDQLEKLSSLYFKGRFREALHVSRSVAEAWERLYPYQREEFERQRCWLRAEAGETGALKAAIALFDQPASVATHYTDLQKVGVAVGLVPHSIVKECHNRFVGLRVGSRSNDYTAIERLYWGMYLLGQEENSAAEEALGEALELEVRGQNEQRVLARMGDALAEVLRRRGDIPRALRILNENIAYREDADISPGPSYILRAKCQAVEGEALNDLRIGQMHAKRNHPKDLIRAQLIEARITSDKDRQEALYSTVLRSVRRFPGIQEDPKFREIVERWKDWCGISYSPELSYWGL